MLHSLSDQAKIRKQVLYTNKAAWLLCLDVHWAGNLPAATSAVPTRPRQRTRPHFVQKAVNWNNPVQAQDAISFSKVYCFRRYPTPLITKQKKHCNGMVKSYPCSTFEEKWARLALHSVGTIQIEPIVLYQSTNACFEQARWAQTQFVIFQLRSPTWILGDFWDIDESRMYANKPSRQS